MSEKLITGIHHVALKACGVEEFEKTVNFYKEILGLPVMRAWGTELEQGIMLSTGNGLIEIFANGEERKEQGSIPHFALKTIDVDECIRRVADNGYRVTIEPKDICIASDPEFPVRIAFCTGPVGEEIEFFCELV
jgi:catechol 2,3-dioxygenase-like lactoylglutathione lyase family enzyme